MSRKAIVGVLLACVSWAVLAQERALHWDALSVAAQLDDQGALHIVETHTMVFDGAWNGGERIFRLPSGQQLDFAGFSEIDATTGEKTAWSSGNLDRVGEYRFDGTTLRWRARMPDDPPFASAARTYEIRYALLGVLTEQDGAYWLSHDFAFPDRDGEIRVFDASLSLDPLWQTNDQPLQWHAENLQPGQSVVANAAFNYAGTQPPAAVGEFPKPPATDAAMPVRYALCAFMVFFVLMHVMAFVRRERTRGRLRPTVSLDQVDEAWLAAHVFKHRPEVIGAVWDLQTSAAEVAALLARLAQAGLLKSEVRTQGAGWLKREMLHMELTCERDQFSGYERALIDGFFIDGRTIDTVRLRKHYAKRGFSPDGLIRKGIEQQLPSAFARPMPVPKWVYVLTAGLIVAGLALFVVGVIRAVHIAHVPFIAMFVMMFVFMLGLVFGFISRSAVEKLRGKLICVGVFIGLLCAIPAFVLISKVVPIDPWAAAGVTLFSLGLMNAIFSVMWIRQAPETIALRQQLGVVRRYFQRELSAQQPRLKDEWFPYLLAFGLGSHIDKWFKSFGHAGGDSLDIDTSSVVRGGLGGVRSSSSTWTGGGGSFGGAGASGTWASAVSGIAAGVASPSSGSSSGGRSSGGGSRSGGGGGGGW